MLHRKLTRAVDGRMNDDPLFDRVLRFAFGDARRGVMRQETLRLGAVKVALVESTGHVIRLSAPGEMSFLAPLRGLARVEAEQARLDAAAGGGAFLRPGDRETTVGRDHRGPYRALVALAPSPRWPAPSPGFTARRPGAEPLMRSLCDLLGHLMEQARCGAGCLARPAARRAAEALLLDGFAALEEIDTPLAPSEGAAADRVRLAEAYIRAHADEPLTVETIAQAVGVGPRALQAGFRDRLGVTPRALLAEVRLGRARALLLDAAPGETVADVAFESGVTQGGRFAAAYRKRFGESPSETLARAIGPDDDASLRR
mgnify:CR=1 FL=1